MYVIDLKEEGLGRSEYKKSKKHRSHGMILSVMEKIKEYRKYMKECATRTLFIQMKRAGISF
ncbi:hypothetical protein COD05_15085 [Bacillus cereus]|nr:hypothetical protein CN338_27435 [Bacillus cereus]PGP35749.1 hypothetical protein CN989_14920 [Bacillus cereus]PGS12119.1 hypothetical protein COC45_12475 [Bacillus cereus]PGT07936.1 hypothetical protein COD05_15085 [Bacillus cereus]PGT92444.1 hypothetical protein COD18_14210 [Bacillus cereus]